MVYTTLLVLGAFIATALCNSAEANLLGHTNPVQLNATNTTVNSNVTIFSWDPVENINGLQGVKGTIPLPMARQRAESSWRQFYPIETGGARGYHLMRPPEQVAAEMAPVLTSLPPGQQLVLLRGFGEACDTSQVRPAESPECMLIGARTFDDLIESLSYNIGKSYMQSEDKHLIWLKQFFGELRRLAPDVVPTLALEYEKGINYWQIQQLNEFANMSGEQIAPHIEQIFDFIYERFGAELPEELQAYVPGDFGAYWTRPRGRAAVDAWNKYTAKLRNDTLRYHVKTAFESVYGTNVPFRMMNYGDALISNPALRDRNGWPGAPSTISGTHSSPSLYINPGSRHGALTGNINYDLLYTDYAASVNDMLLNHDGDGLKVVPWIAINSCMESTWPSLGFYSAMSRNLVEHLYENGVRTFILFEPFRVYENKTPEELAVMRQNIVSLVDYLHNNGMAPPQEPDGDITPQPANQPDDGTDGQNTDTSQTGGVTNPVNSGNGGSPSGSGSSDNNSSPRRNQNPASASGASAGSGGGGGGGGGGGSGGAGAQTSYARATAVTSVRQQYTMLVPTVKTGPAAGDITFLAQAIANAQSLQDLSALEARTYALQYTMSPEDHFNLKSAIESKKAIFKSQP